MDTRTGGRTDARMENICSIFRDKLLLLGEHGYYLATVVGDNEIGDNRNEGGLLAISIAMAMQWYDMGHIAR